MTKAKNPSTFLNDASPSISGRNSSSFNLNNLRMINSGTNNFFSLVRAATVRDTFQGRSQGFAMAVTLNVVVCELHRMYWASGCLGTSTWRISYLCTVTKLYTNRIFFTYLYLDNTTGMTHLKRMSWSPATHFHRLTSHKRKGLSYCGETSNLAYWAGWLNGLEFWSVFWRKIRNSSVIIVTTLRDWRPRNRVSIVGKGKKCITFRALVILKRYSIEF